MKLHQPTATAYLVDKTGKVHEVLPIYAKNAKKDVAAMNGTANKATDGNLFWTLEQPKEAA